MGGRRIWIVSKPLSGRSLLQEGGERHGGRLATVSKPLSGRSLLQGLPLKRQGFDDFARLFPIPSANLPLTLDSPRII